MKNNHSHSAEEYGIAEYAEVGTETDNPDGTRIETGTKREQRDREI